MIAIIPTKAAPLVAARAPVGSPTAGGYSTKFNRASSSSSAGPNEAASPEAIAGQRPTK